MRPQATKDITARLDFIRKAGQLKDTLRSAWTAAGRTESTAEHTWRLTLLIITFADEFPGIDLQKLLKMCILHDLGEAVSGDIPAPSQLQAKGAEERLDFQSLIEELPVRLIEEFTELWDEYEAGVSPEAEIAKAFDKLETILQHNQGSNPDDFDYAFNLDYGKAYTDAVPLAKEIRQLLDVETSSNME